MTSDNSILCYCAAVKKQIQPETLTQALNQLILYNEMLQVRLENGRYAPEPGTATDEAQRGKLLSIYDAAGRSPAEVETLIGQILEKMAGEIRGERGASIRAVLLTFDGDCNKLLLLSHHAIVDGRGIVLLFEDLYRIYEQLSNGKKVALRPVRKTYLEVIKEAAAMKSTESSDPSFNSRFMHDLSESVISDANCWVAADRQKTAAFSIMLDRNFKRRLFSWRIEELELSAVGVLAGALLRSLAKADQGKSLNIWITSDYRLADETLMYTAGALTQTYRLWGDFAEERELFSDLMKLRGILSDISLHCSPPDLPQSAPQLSTRSDAEQQLRLNLEYLTDEPWLGGDEWAPEGFIMSEKGQAGGDYSIEIMPVLLSDGINIFVEYRETTAVKALVEKFAAYLILELETTLHYCEGYADKLREDDDISSLLSKDAFNF